MLKRILTLLLLVVFANCVLAQVEISTPLSKINYSSPKEYEIGGITVSGVKYLDQNVLVHLSGLKVGNEILVPGDKITKAIEKLWKQGLFSDVKISATKILGNRIFFDIYLKERPRLSKFTFTGVTKSEIDDLKEDINLIKGSQVTDNVLINTQNTIKKFYVEKGFLKTFVSIQQIEDTSFVNNVILQINVHKNEKVKINEIVFEGNTLLSEGKLRRSMKGTKRKVWYNIFKASKLIDKNYEDDKKKLIAKELAFGISYDYLYIFDLLYLNYYYRRVIYHKFRPCHNHPIGSNSFLYLKY